MNNNSTMQNDSKSEFSLQFQPFTDEVVPPLAAVILLQMLIGLAGNTITVFVITKSKKLKNDPFMNVIASLCCSDLLSASVSWILLYRRTWGFNHFDPLPKFFCNLFFSVDLMTSFTTAMHIFFFALMRFQALRPPHMLSNFKLWKIRIVLASLWLLAFTSGFVPMFYFSEAKSRNRTGDNPDARWPACTLKAESLDAHKTYQLVTYTSFLFLPAFGIVVTSYLINQIIQNPKSSVKRNARQSKKEKQASLQLFLIVIMFFVGYIPMGVYDLWAVRLGNWTSQPYYHKLDYWVGMSAYICLRTAECVNPIMYNLGSSKIRAQTKFYFWRCGGKIETSETSFSNSRESRIPPKTISKRVDATV